MRRPAHSDHPNPATLPSGCPPHPAQTLTSHHATPLCGCLLHHIGMLVFLCRQSQNKDAILTQLRAIIFWRDQGDIFRTGDKSPTKNHEMISHPHRIKCKHLIVYCKSMIRSCLPFQVHLFPPGPVLHGQPTDLFSIPVPSSDPLHLLGSFSRRWHSWLTFQLQIYVLLPKWLWPPWQKEPIHPTILFYPITSLSGLWSTYQHMKLSVCVFCLFNSVGIWSFCSALNSQDGEVCQESIAQWVWTKWINE